MPPKKNTKAKGKATSAAPSDASGSDTSRISTGNLTSHPKAIDIHIDGFSLQYHGLQLIQDTTLELNYGRRYGLLGLNGSGKSTLMKCLGHREVPIPERFNIYFLEKEMEASDKSAIDSVVEDIESERTRLEAEADSLADDEDAAEALNVIYERIEDLDPDLAKVKAAKILHGLGFTPDMQNMKSREFSGGWRMRISLAKALFIKPMLLLLDEPTNHLDVESCVWLEEYLKAYPHILVIVSHSQDFLNGVCTNIMNLSQNKLKYYAGNYDAFIKTRAEVEENQMKIYNREQADIQRMTEYIAKFGHGSAKLARQAQSKEKVLAKMKEGGLTEKVATERSFAFRFNDPGELPPPVLQFDAVSFGYPGKRLLYRNLDLGIDLDSRIALVGPNGVGKSTLLKLMIGELQPVEGAIKRHSHLRFGRYHQHLTEEMDMDLSPCEYMLSKFPGIITKETVRSSVGRFGITGELQLKPIRTLSDGQRSRLAFATIAYQNPHLLLLDEPTNHLDMETIDSLAEAINEFEGGLILVSHDFRLITQVAEEIWECNNTTVSKFSGTILEYKTLLKKSIEVDL